MRTSPFPAAPPHSKDEWDSYPSAVISCHGESVIAVRSKSLTGGGALVSDNQDTCVRAGSTGE